MPHHEDEKIIFQRLEEALKSSGKADAVKFTVLSFMTGAEVIGDPDKVDGVNFEKEMVFMIAVEKGLEFAIKAGYDAAVDVHKAMVAINSRTDIPLEQVERRSVIDKIVEAVWS